MFENIFVATDGSDNANRAVEVGAKLAASCGAQLTIIHVAPRFVSLQEVERSRELPPEIREEIDKMRNTMGGFEVSAFAPVPAPQSAVEFLGNAVLEQAEGIARENGASQVSRSLVFGDAAELIVAEATRAGADMIVIGTRGLGELGSLFMGSVSHKVIQLSDCPCVTVK